jgi:hypothetical protein
MTRRILLVAALILLSGQAFAQSSGGRDFNHVQTLFPLTGAHMQARCESCHVGGRFKGTPTQCAFCHEAGSRMSSVVKPRNHMPTAQTCDSCHNTTTFAGARFNHIGIAPGSCMSCHNSMTAPGKPANHIATTASCDSCHRTTAWSPAGFNHMGVAPGTCATCHNGARAAGKPANHVMTAAACDSCHRTTAWIPATFSHTAVAPGTCAICHNGSQATGKPANHIMTTASCDSCHRTSAWIPATFSHATVAPGSCAACHNGSSARGKPANHFVTTQSCDTCHRTTAWLPVTAYTHKSPYYRPHAAGVTCLSCHKTNSEVLAWPFAAYKPDCAGCHASTFKPDPHKKVDSPAIFYTVSELRNCAGSCHQYTDSTFTTIRRMRSGEHRSTDGGF